jgi:hypothetical protein
MQPLITGCNRNLLAPSFTLAPFARAVNVRHQSILLDLKAAQILVRYLSDSNGSASRVREQAGISSCTSIADRLARSREVRCKNRSGPTDRNTIHGGDNNNTG